VARIRRRAAATRLLLQLKFSLHDQKEPIASFRDQDLQGLNQRVHLIAATVADVAVVNGHVHALATFADTAALWRAQTSLIARTLQRRYRHESVQKVLLNIIS
jgi:hypothetical protein